jgi:hypothetical protein
MRKDDSLAKIAMTNKVLRRLLDMMFECEPPHDKKKPKTTERIWWEAEYEEVRWLFIDLHNRSIEFNVQQLKRKRDAQSKTSA